MAKTVTKYSIFLSSPSDLEEERIAVEDVIRELNLTFGSRQNLILELIKWETHSAPGISITSPQDVINKDIGDDYDVFIGILWKKFGTPTETAGSGTEEEFLRAFKRFQENKHSLQVLFYFKNAVPKSMKEIDANELLKIETFKNELSQKNVLYKEFDTCENLMNLLRMHIPKRIEDLIKNGSLEADNNNLVEVAEFDNEMGLLDYSEMFESLINDATVSLTKIGDSTGWVGEELSHKTDELTKISKQSNPNRVVLKEIFKRTAKILNDYSKRLETEIPIYYSSFEEAIKNGTNLINLTDDFESDDTLENLVDTKEAMFAAKASISGALESTRSFYESVESIPRIQKELNAAKKNLLYQLDDLNDKLVKSFDLTVEFSKEIGDKIDKMKIRKRRDNLEL